MKHNIIFLDIDGVIIGFCSQKRFNYDTEKTIASLCEKYHTDIYDQINHGEVCAMYYDIDSQAIEYLRRLLEDHNAKLVIHSGWRMFNSTQYLSALLELHGLGKYVYDICDPTMEYKVDAIHDYLEKHKDEINEYLVIDDDDFYADFGYRYIQTKDIMDEDNYRLADYIFRYGINLKIEKEQNRYTINYYHDQKLYLQLSTHLVGTNEHDLIMDLHFKEIEETAALVYFSMFNELRGYAYRDCYDMIRIKHTPSPIYRLIDEDCFINREGEMIKAILGVSIKARAILEEW